MWSYVLCVCLVAATVVPANAAEGAMSRHQLELKEHYEHLAKIAEFECNEPQPRLLNVNELLSDLETRGKAYFPEVTLLYRCDRHVGSCNDATYQCGPTQAVEVKMPFKVTFLEAMLGRNRGEWKMEYYTLQNHTACGCLKYDGPPPAKTAVHYHYIDPSLVPAQNLPLDSSSQSPSGTANSYDVPVYQVNTTGPSIYDVTKMAEEEVKPSDEENKAQPDDEVKSKPDENNRPDEDVKYKPGEDTPCLLCTEDEFSGFPGFNPSSTEPSIDNFFNKDSPNDRNDADADATTIPSELIRFGSGDSPRSERSGALSNPESPYDSYLRQASS